MQFADPSGIIVSTDIMHIGRIHFKVVLICWITMVMLTSALGIASWVFHIDGGSRVIANTSYMFALPGWIVMYAAGLGAIRDHPLGIISANALAWGGWFWCLWAVWCVRTRWVHSDKHSPEPEPEPSEPLDRSRRAFLCNATLGTAAIGVAAAPGYATLIEPWSIKVRKYTVAIKDLDPSFEGLKLVQLADTHLGPRIPASFVQQAIDLVLAQQPDLVLLTGDHVHDGVQEIELAAQICRPLVEQASIGAVGVLGNHDWWGDGRLLSSKLAGAGVHMIDNDRIWLDAKFRTLVTHDPGEGALAIVGFGDLTDDHIDLDRAFRGVADQTPRLVLSHNPDAAELPLLIKPGSPRVDLMCSGHTHGGQVRIPLIGTPIIPSNYGSKYAGGLVKGPAFPVHISRGIGMSLLPVRVGVPPEISVITLMRG